MENIFNQSPYKCRMDWGQRGAKQGAERGDILIIVDVLSFSSAVTTAVHFGLIVYPFNKGQESKVFANSIGALIGTDNLSSRKEAKEKGELSLSPLSFKKQHKNTKIVLASTNGGTCVKYAKEAKTILIGCLLNATAVAFVANKIAQEKNANITVIACGERWSSNDDGIKELRPSIEDYLGVGAILSKLEGSKSPEAEVCINAFESSKNNLDRLVLDSSSGRELVSCDLEEDVAYSSQLDYLKDVPLLNETFFVNFNSRE